MRKIIISMLTLLSSLSISASSYKDIKDIKLNHDLSFYIGLNFIHPAPVWGAKVSLEFFCLKASFDVGKTFIFHPLSESGIVTASPSIGVVFGRCKKVYLMIGVQNYGFINNLVDSSHFRSDHLYGLVRAGFQHFFRERLFFSIEATHLFHDNKSGFEHFPSTNLCFGLGFTF